MGPYSLDLRQRVLDAYQNGIGSIRGVAALFEIVPNTVLNWLRLAHTTGSVAPRPHGGGVPPIISGGALAPLAALVEAQPDATLPELRARLEPTCHLTTSDSAVCRALQVLKLSRKRRRSTRTRATARRSSRAARSSAFGSPRSTPRTGSSSMSSASPSG
jgi:transposase